MIAYDYFVKRRKLKTENIIRFNNLDTYEKFCEYMKQIRVLPPKKTEYEEGREKVWPTKKEVKVKSEAKVKNEKVEERDTSNEKTQSKPIRRRARKKSVTPEVPKSSTDG